jgi:hypothetical protein
MTQKVSIDVGVNSSGAADGIKKVDAATAGLEKRLDGVNRTAAKAADQVAKLEAVAIRLSKAFARPVDDVSAAMGNDRFERMRAGGGFGSRRMKQFNSFEDWFDNHGATFQRQTDEQRHRQFILAGAMRGTPFAGGGGAIPPIGGAGGRPGLTWEAYAYAVTHSFLPFRSFTTTIDFDRGTDFIVRSQREGGADSPYYAEMSPRGVY